ncbi:pentatricopeptide repeat-containing protein At1g63130, mitochondrial isoform X3 [Prunus persica]|uniref:pentatricopeptide repeat-containing protein At1g63130, mitochondrial isoform X3 n=1 Tax=Prunus persica TaxID=3760 RepID=UPI0009AB6E40|nr:pentatricopeptide repeat-containing protein At1g63130, mitochondrial isoform X3 [Prunus persica]
MIMMIMMRRSASSSYCNRRHRGNPCLQLQSRSRVFFSNNNYLGLFHGSSQSSNPSKSKSRDPQHPFDVTNLEEASNMFKKMLKQRPRPSIVRFTQLLGQVAKLEHYSVAISWYKQITLLGMGLVPDAFTLNIIVNCFCRSNEMGGSFSVLALFFKLGLQPDVTTLNILIRGLGHDNRVDEAASLVHKMAAFGEGCKPNVITFGTLIAASCKQGQNDRAIEMLRMMEKNDCKPNVVVYSTIIDSLCKDKLVDEAFNLFSEMKRKGIPPNIVTYTSLFQGLCRLGQWKEASRFFKEMNSNGISPNVQTFSALVDCLCKEGKLKEANQVIDILTARGNWNEACSLRKRNKRKRCGKGSRM